MQTIEAIPKPSNANPIIYRHCAICGATHDADNLMLCGGCNFQLCESCDCGCCDDEIAEAETAQEASGKLTPITRSASELANTMHARARALREQMLKHGWSPYGEEVWVPLCEMLGGLSYGSLSMEMEELSETVGDAERKNSRVRLRQLLWVVLMAGTENSLDAALVAYQFSDDALTTHLQAVVEGEADVEGQAA